MEGSEYPVITQSLVSHYVNSTQISIPHQQDNASKAITLQQIKQKTKSKVLQ